MKKYILFIMIVMLATFGFVCLPIITQKPGVIYYLPAGESKTKFIDELADRHIIQLPYIYKLFVIADWGQSLKKGEYLFPSNASFPQIWYQVTHGRGHYLRAFTILPGSNWHNVLEACQASFMRHLIPIKHPNEVARLIDPTLDSLEGVFLPETYYYTRGESDIAVLKRARNLMQEFLMANWPQRAQNLPYQNPYAALIAASLIEKEAYYPNEQAMIAGVLINRLRKNMLLQFDPTVIYGVGDNYHQRISKVDLLNPNPYNTYVHKGLPPTPIANPGKGAIMAALHPATHEYLYFVAIGDHHHQFSTSLGAHHLAVENAKSRSSKPLPKQATKDYINWPTLQIKSLLLPSLLATELIIHEAR